MRIDEQNTFCVAWIEFDKVYIYLFAPAPLKCVLRRLGNNIYNRDCVGTRFLGGFFLSFLRFIIGFYFIFFAIRAPVKNFTTLYRPRNHNNMMKRAAIIKDEINLDFDVLYTRLSRTRQYSEKLQKYKINQWWFHAH